jgi:hypothetical protein
LTIRAHKWARAVYDRLKRKAACDRETFFQSSGRGADEPAASLDTKGVTRKEALKPAACPAAANAKAPRGQETRSPPPLMGHPLPLLLYTALVAHGLRGLLLPRAWLSLDNVDALSPLFE